VNPLGLSSVGNDPSTWGTGVKRAIHNMFNRGSSYFHVPLTTVRHLLNANAGITSMLIFKYSFYNTTTETAGTCRNTALNNRHK